MKRAGLLTASLFVVVVQASLLRSSSWSWLHWDWIGGTQLEGSRGQSYVPAPGYCAQEFENAAILNLVTTFLPLPSAPASLTKACPRLSSPSDGTRKLSSGFPTLCTSVSAGCWLCYMCCSIVLTALIINLSLNSKFLIQYYSLFL